MIPNKTCIVGHEQRTRMARLAAREAREQFRESLSAAAVSPAALASGAMLGMRVGKAMHSSRPQKRKNSSRGLRLLGILLPLWRLLQPTP